MNLTFSTLGCPDWGIDEVLGLAREFGIDSVELRGLGDALDIDRIPEFRPERRAAFDRLLSEWGVRLCALDCSAFLAPQASWERARAETEYALQLAAEWGVPFIRVFGGSREDGQAAKCVAQRLKVLCAQDKRVTVLLETHDSFSDAASLSSVVEAAACENFGLLWDVEHTLRAGVDSAAFVREFGPFIRHVHLKDYDGKGLCLPGEGTVDFRCVVDLLQTAGYVGLFSLEWEKRWVTLLPDMRRALACYTALMRA